jgi:4-hydroxybutyrate CoA-transferase
MDARADFEHKLMTPDQAVQIVHSGDLVGIPIGVAPASLCQALSRRRGELHDVTVSTRSPQVDPGWFGPGWRDSFRIVVDTVVGIAGPAIDNHLVDYTPWLTSQRFKAEDEARPDARRPDVAFVIVSPPDADGMCSFGHRLSHKKSYARRARKIIAEVDRTLLRPVGEGYLHVSEIAAFVEHVPQTRTLPSDGISAEATLIAPFVKQLLRDGDTIQLGPGGVLDALPDLGLFADFNDLGCHSAVARPTYMRALGAGNFTGARKTTYPGVAVSSGWEATDDCLAMLEGNRKYLLLDQEQVNDIRTIASHDNMVAINGAISVDLGGQIGADTIGPRLYHGSAGQIEFAIGAALSRGGRNITIVQSTAAHGRVSRIVPMFEPGTVVSVLRPFADYVVTEFGIAALWGKSLRERAEALIGVAHPSFSEELRSEARRLYGL